VLWPLLIMGTRALHRPSADAPAVQATIVGEPEGLQGLEGVSGALLREPVIVSLSRSERMIRGIRRECGGGFHDSGVSLLSGGL
jgi:hypothetical protein